MAEGGRVLLREVTDANRAEYLGPYFLWRLLIDARHRGRDYGRSALDLVVAYVRARPNAERLLTSIVPGEVDSPRDFSLGYGFTFTGDVDDGELVLELPLTPQLS